MAKHLFDTTSNCKIKIAYDDSLEKLFMKRTEIISFSSNDLLYDIMTCGMPHFFNGNRCTEILYKIYLIETALEIDDDYIIISDKLKYLDSSERAFISYYIGMIMTKLVSREIFKFKYLVHLGIIDKYTQIDRDTNEPDLVGFTKMKNGYTLFEAKGRKISPRKNMIMAAKSQIKSIKNIGGKKPDMGVVCVAHPIIEKKQLTCSLFDPIPNKGIPINMNESKLLYLYYLPIYELIKEIGDNEPQCKIHFDKNINDRIECNIKMSKSLFDLFTEYPIFDKLDNNCLSELECITSNSSDETKDDLLTIELL